MDSIIRRLIHMKVKNGVPAAQLLVGWHETYGFHGLLWGPGDVVPDLGLAPLVEIPRK